MAESVVKLKVDDKDYNASLRNAKQGLMALEQSLQNAGKTFTDVDQKVVEYVRSIGRMDTVSRSARGKIGEMTQAFTELAVQYRHLTDEEKKGEYGKALSASLDQLKKRIGEAKEELRDVGKEMEDDSKSGESFGGVVDALAGKFGLSTKALGVWGAALAAGTVAVNVAKDAFFNNEQQLDEWERVVESSQSVYEGFLNALNTGEINGFLNNINSIVRAASAAYDALDALNTFNAFNQVQVEKTRTAMTESIVDYREGNAKKEDVKAAGEAYKKELEERKKYEREAYLEAIGKVAAERGVNKSDLVKALSGSYGNYKNLKEAPLTGTVTKYSPGIMPGSQGSYSTYKVAANERERLGEALRQLNDTELQALQALGAQAERTGNEIAQVDRQLVRVLNGRNGATKTTGGGAGVVKSNTKTTPQWQFITPSESLLGMVNVGRTADDVNRDLSKWNKRYNSATDAYERADAMSHIERLNDEKDSMKELAEMVADPFKQIHDEFKEEFGKDGKKNSPEEKVQRKNSDSLKDIASTMQGVLGGVGNITSGLSQLGVELPKELQNVVSLLSGVSTILSGIAAIVALISVDTKVTAGASVANAVIPFAQGGIVGKAANGMLIPGNSFSGDNLRMPIWDGGGMIGVNSGELILSKSQQNNLASALRQRSSGGGAQPFVTGENIYLGLNNYLRANGYGEIVTSRNS